MIDVKHLDKFFGDNHVLKDLNEHIEQGEKGRYRRTFRLWQEYIFTVSEFNGKADFRTYCV